MPPTTATPARKIGRYEVLDELGRGAMGVVYRARDTQIGRIVALKMILTTTASCGDVELYKQRFHREAQAAGRLSHPGIVTIHDIAEDEAGQPYMVMEFVEGKPLDACLSNGRGGVRPSESALDIGIQVARALAYAHQHGVVHRDVKPANILVTADGRVKIADFGIAKLAGAEMTQEGTSLGTPSYMSPEQFRAAAVDARSDQFSLGAVLFWMCTGRKPFDGDSVTTISFQIVFEALPSATQLTPGLPRELDAVLARAMAKKPEDRYANCNELAEDLEALRAGRPVKAPAVPAATKRDSRGGASTSSSPADSGNDETLPITAPSGLERTRASAPATIVAAPEPRRVRVWMAAVVAGMLIALAGGVYWVRAGSGGAAGSPGAAVAAPPASTAAQAGGTPGVTTGTPGAAAAAVTAVPETAGNAQPAPAVETPTTTRAAVNAPAAPIPAASSKLRVVCKHNFQSATLEVFVDNQLLFKTPLHGREHNYGLMKVYDGILETERPVPAGAHMVRAWVTSRREGYDEQAATGGSFSEGKSRTLEIEFGKGSATGVIGRKLDLTLR